MRIGSKGVALAAGLATAIIGAAAGTAIAASGPASSHAALGAGQTGTAAQVPWRQVGPGWELVQYDASTNTVGHIKPGALTLYLVDPAGGRYQMYRWPAKAAVRPSLVDWSGDKARAVFAEGTNTIQQLNLRNGKIATITLQHASFPVNVNYTRPDGASLLVADGTSPKMTVYRLDGTVLRQLAGAYQGAIQSADGTTLVVPARHGLTLITNAGRVVRSLPVGRACSPLRYWDARAILAMCAQDRLWLVPVSGRAPSALTSARLTPPDLENLGAWRLPSGLYLQAAGPCGSLFIARQHSNGRTSVVKVPGTNGQRNQIITAAGSRLLVEAGTGCMPSNSLLWFNPGTHAEQWLIRAPRTVDGVQVVIPFYSREYQAGV